MLLALLLSQARPTGFYLLDEGSSRGVATRLNCVGSGVSCTNASGTATITISGGGAGGAPTDAKYLVQQAHAELDNEQALGALGSGLMLNTTSTGVVSIYAGTSCSNQFIRSMAASGLATCAAVSLLLDVTGVLPVANGGLGLGAPVDDAVPVGTAGLVYAAAVLPNCLDVAGAHLNYNATTNTFSCGTSSGGGGSFVEWEVDFGSTGTDIASSAVTAAWVTDSTKLMCAPTLLSTADRAEGAEDAIIEQLTVAPHTRVNGVGFTITAAPAQGRAYGKYKFHCVGG